MFLVHSFLSIILHTGLDPFLSSRGLLFKLLLRHLSHLEGSVRGRNMATGLEAGALEELVKPLLQVGEFGEVDTSPLCSVLLVCAMQCWREGDLLALATQPQQEISAMVTLSPTM